VIEETFTEVAAVEIDMVETEAVETASEVTE
jgi:hypothetical protein